MKRILALGLVAMALLFAAPRAPTAIGQGSTMDRMVRDLEDTVLKMDVRLERLEALASKRSPSLYDPRDTMIDDEGTAPRTPSRSSAPRWVMQLDGVDTVDPDPDAYKELERLQRDVESLERQVERQKRTVSSSMGSSGGSSRSYRSHRTNRQGRAQGELLANYQREYRQKKGDMKRLERHLSKPRQNHPWQLEREGHLARDDHRCLPGAQPDRHRRGPQLGRSPYSRGHRLTGGGRHVNQGRRRERRSPTLNTK